MRLDSDAFGEPPRDASAILGTRPNLRRRALLARRCAVRAGGARRSFGRVFQGTAFFSRRVDVGCVHHIARVWDPPGSSSPTGMSEI